MGFEKNRFKVSAKPFNMGSIIFDLFLFYPVRIARSPSPFPSPQWGEGGVRGGVYPFNETINPVTKRLISANGIKIFQPNFMI